MPMEGRRVVAAVGGDRDVTNSALYPAEAVQDAGTQLASPNPDQ
jgi:hypothetical protein